LRPAPDFGRRSGAQIRDPWVRFGHRRAVVQAENRWNPLRFAHSGDAEGCRGRPRV